MLIYRDEGWFVVCSGLTEVTYVSEYWRTENPRVGAARWIVHNFAQVVIGIYVLGCSP